MSDLELAAEQAKKSESSEEAASPAAEENHPHIEAIAGPTVDELERRLAEAVEAAERDRDRFVRAQAEMENMRRRAEKDLQNAHKFALERFAKELLAVVDSLELGLQAADADASGPDALREGMSLTLKQLLAVLERFEIRPIDPAGQRFNPEWHQAMATEQTGAMEPGSVVRVFQKGYSLNERLLRPAMVVVSQPLAAASDVDEEA